MPAKTRATHPNAARVPDGQIVEAIGYCSGEWDEEPRARHALEAPLFDHKVPTKRSATRQREHMADERIHRAVSPDGTELAGRVQGQGPPLVLIHAGLGDGGAAWLFMLADLVEHFTCYLMNTRGRHLSAKRRVQARSSPFALPSFTIEIF